MKIIQLTAENVKRLTAVQITPDGNLVQITGKNGQGKTSVLDSIWWALAGIANIQSQPIRKGADKGRVELSLGENGEVRLIVERTFTKSGSYLTVKNADGFKASSPQKMLDDLLGALTFDPLGFMRQPPRRQFETLRALVPLDIDVAALDRERAEVFDKRTDINREMKRLEAQADGIKIDADWPTEKIDTTPIVAELAGVDAYNGKIREQHRHIEELRKAEQSAAANIVKVRDHWNTLIADAENRVAEAKRALAAAQEGEERARVNFRAAVAKAQDDADAAAKLLLDAEKIEISDLLDPAELSANLLKAQGDNMKVQKRAERDAIRSQAADCRKESEKLTARIDAIDTTKAKAIAAAPMPIENLGFGDGAVTFKGVPLDQASDAEQLMVSTAIAAALNPKLRVLRIRDGSLLDDDSVALLAAFADERDLQIWIERVDGSGTVGVVMEDGHVRGQDLEKKEAAE